MGETPPRWFGETLKEMREECGLTQPELAKEIGLTNHIIISLWEHNKRDIPANKLWQAACVCGHTVKIEPSEARGQILLKR